MSIPAITVYCNEQIHDEPQNVATYARNGAQGWFRVNGTRGVEQDDGFVSLGTWDGESEGQSLVGDEPVNVATADASEVRWRHRLECHGCGYTVPARQEKLDDRLERLWAHGVSRVSLRGLAASLR